MAEATVKYGLLAEFDTTADILHAAAQVRDAGYRRWDVYTPFPIHGMDDAMGLKKSQVGWFAFCCGATGLTLGYLMIWWMNAADYAITVGGKPLVVVGQKKSARVKRRRRRRCRPPRSCRPVRTSTTRPRNA